MSRFHDIAHELLALGYREMRRRGSHRLFSHPVLGIMVVPHHPGRDIRPRLAVTIRWQIKRAQRRHTAGT